MSRRNQTIDRKCVMIPANALPVENRTERNRRRSSRKAEVWAKMSTAYAALSATFGQGR